MSQFEPALTVAKSPLHSLTRSGVSERPSQRKPRLVHAIDFPPATGGEKSTYTCAEESEYWREYGLSLVAGADDGIGGTVIIDGGPSSETGTRPDSCADEGVPPAMPRAAGGYFLHARARKSLVCSIGPDDDGIVGGGLELAFEGFLAVDHDEDLLSGAELCKVVPCRILGATERGTDEQAEEWEHHAEAKCAHSESPV